MSPFSHNIPSAASPQSHGLSPSPRPPVRANQYTPGRPEARSHILSKQASFFTPAANLSMNLPAHPFANERDRTFTPDHPASSLSSIPMPISLEPPASRAPAGFGVKTSLSSDSSSSTTFAVAAPRSSSLPFSSVAPMGQGVSKSHSDSASLGTPSPPPSNTPSKSLGNAGQKLRRALARRRKVDESLLVSITSDEGQGRYERQGGEYAPALIPAASTSLAPAKVTSSLWPAPPSPKFSQLATNVLNAGKRTAKATLPPHLNQPQLRAATPPPPEVYSNAGMRRKLPPIPVPAKLQQNQLPANNINRSSIIPISPGISSAINFMRSEAIAQEQMTAEPVQEDPSTLSSKMPVRLMVREAAEAPVVLGNPRERGQDKGPDPVPPEVKEAWRKSDSAMSYHTIRPGAGSSRPSRPTSVAESLHSNHTVVPVKRLSGLIGDADFGMPEEDDSGSQSREDSGLVANQYPKASTTPTKTKNRRSISLNIGANPFRTSPPSTPPLSNATDMRSASFSPSEALASTKPKDAPAFAQAGFANPPFDPAQPPNYGSPWNIGHDATMQNIDQSISDHRKPSLPLSHRFMVSNAPRQPSISMTSTFAPAAGLARKAVEKIGWPWSSHSHSHSVASNSNASSSPSQASHPENALTRTNSNQSVSQATTGIQSMHKLLRPKARRTPNGPSGSWSISSNTTASSVSDSDIPPSEPIVGRCLRPALRGKAGGPGGAAGMVFGRELIRVVHETAIMDGVTIDPQYMEPPPYLGLPTDVAARWSQARAFELRRLPALAARCAQHLLIWGVQEEGLFRVSGRPAHVAKIRMEFDSGADFDMIECTPGDLDPHAVASVFKAYLRELPEPLLTHALMPYFEGALMQENKTPTSPAPTSRSGGRGPGLPSGPRLTPGNPPLLRKPPSLSTLAMPVMTRTQPPSKELIGTLTKLIEELPQENRDLLRTVTDLMKVTASQSKETKMPLSNLLLVFCPSLNMNPPLLRALCEISDIWGDEPDVSAVIDIKRQTLVPGRREVEGDDGLYRPRSAYLASEAFRTSDSRRSGDDPLTDEDDDDDSTSNSRKRDTIHAPQPSFTTSSDTPSLQDDSSCSSSTHPDTPSPAFSLSSTESLATPPTSSGAPSVAHLPTEQDPISRLNPGDDSPIAAGTDALAITPSKGTNDYPPPSTTPLVEFPASQEPVPNTPMSKRKSISTLSLMGARAPATHSPSTPDSPSSFSPRRLKKPSLHLLFSKRSASSLNSIPKNHLTAPSPYLHETHSASDTSVSTPISSVTAQSSPRNLVSVRPQLDTPIDDSPRLGIKYAYSPASPGLPRGTSSKATSGSNMTPKPSEGPPSQERLGSHSNAPSHLRPHPTRGRLGHYDNVSTTLLTLSTENEPEEDWTQSVLLAADVEGTWLSRSR